MSAGLPPLLLISQKISEYGPRRHAAAMRPVIDARHQKTEDKDTYRPSEDLAVQGFNVCAANR